MWGPGWGMGGSMGGFGLIFWLVILAGIIGAVWLVASVSKTGSRERRSPGRELLEERYARGEISRDEYLKKKRDLEN